MEMLSVGRPKRPYKLRALQVRCDDEEWAKLLASLPRDTRERFIQIIEGYDHEKYQAKTTCA